MTRLAILGSGALARALVEALPRSRSLRTSIAARRPAAARSLARLRPGTVAARSWDEAVRDADVVVLAVDDRAIPLLAEELASVRKTWSRVAVLHAAGALGPEALEPLIRRGAAAGVIHPILPLSRRGGSPLRGAHARIEGSPTARRAASAIARAVGLIPLPRSRRTRPSDRELHHAAASLATNDVVALLALAEDALVSSGVPRGASRRAVLAAAAATLTRLAASGPAGALSGPVVRGDASRILRHVRALSGVAAAAGPAHLALSRRLVGLAVASARLDRAEGRRLLRELDPAPARGPKRRRTV